jgi:very-short-patch-repair endonuclease
MSAASTEKAWATIETWCAGLTDFSGRNPLLFFRPSKSGTLQLADDPAALFSALIAGKRIPVRDLLPASPPPEVQTIQPAATDNTDGMPLGRPDVEVLCTKLRRKARTVSEETGISPLMLAFSFCEWSDPRVSTGAANAAARRCKAPIVLMPVSLQRQSTHGATVLLYEGGEILINPVLRSALARDFGLSLPEEPEGADLTLADLLGCIEALKQDPRFQITPAVVLGLFSFSRLVMVKDLEANAERILTHPMLGALLGLRSLPAEAPVIAAEDLDRHFDQHPSFSVLDADSSQQVAIEAVKAGRSLVVQGPPGTGKSQTITNMIAELLATGKRVLFVSAKRAALEVVLRNMEKAHLDDLCLSVHEGADKKKVIDDLFTTCERAQTFRPVGLREAAQTAQLRQSRQQLDDHVRLLHTRHPEIGLSIFEAYGRVCADRHLPAVTLAVHDPSLFTSAAIDDLTEAVTAVVGHADLLEGKRQSLWHSTSLPAPISYQQQAEITGWLNTLDVQIAHVHEIVGRVAAVAGVAVPALRCSDVRWTLDLADSLSSGQIEPAWLDGASQQRAVAFESLSQMLRAYQQARAEVLTVYSQGIFALPLVEIQARLEQEYPSGLTRLFSKAFRRDRAALAAVRTAGTPSYRQMREEVAAALAVQRQEEALQQDEQAHATFGTHFRGPTTDATSLKDALDASARVVSLLQGKAEPQIVYALMQQSGGPGLLTSLRDDGRAALEQVEGAKAQIGRLFTPAVLSEWRGDTDLAQARHTAIELRATLSHLTDWLAFQAARRRLAASGFPDVIAALQTAEVPLAAYAVVFRRAMIAAWIQYQHAQQPALGTFKGGSFEALIAAFNRLDVDDLGQAQQAIRATHANGIRSFLSRDQAQYERLAREAVKRRQVWPVRKLLAHIPKLLLQIKPCWMMSPLTVTQMIDAERVHFDVVIFDEASQIRTEEGICAILRADQVVVVGDNKQLPPTSFFDLVRQDEGDEQDDEADFESILDRCAVQLQRLMLRWHYRSRDESLIAFSNQTYYHGQLVTFPTADRRPGSGLSFRHVPDGVYGRSGSRANAREAQVVAEMIVEHYRGGGPGSLGVIALSQAQQAAIEDALEQALRASPDVEVPEDGPDALFVKNLENVQGDERDHIILSIGYGKDANGVLRLNFGPLNRQGGGRRLNVAITRARQSLSVVSSIKAGDIDLSRTASEAVRQLHDYLAFAESGGERLLATSFAEQHFDSPFEEDVWLMLRDRGHHVHSQVGCSHYRIDLAIVDPRQPGSYLLGIECDGATYHSSPTARDRDRLRQAVLEGLGWTIHRIWSRDWIRDKEAEIARLEAHLQQVQVRRAAAEIVQIQQCPQCGASIRAGARFCGHCRAVVA